MQSSYLSIAGVKCHNQGSIWKEVFTGFMISERFHNNGGGHTAAGSWKRKPRDHLQLQSEIEVGRAINIQSSLPMTHFVQQGLCPNSITSWGQNIQIPECLGDTAHLNYQTCHLPYKLARFTWLGFERHHCWRTAYCRVWHLVLWWMSFLGGLVRHI